MKENYTHTDPNEVDERWKEYFRELINSLGERDTAEENLEDVLAKENWMRV